MRTLSQAARSASRAPIPANTFSCVASTLYSAKKGAKPKRSGFRHNLTTDAAGATGRRDWQARAMGLGPAFAFATAVGAAAAGITVSATSLTNSGAAFPTTLGGLQGCIVVAYGLANNSFVYGVICSNTATTLTIDQWYNGASTTGAAGTTPTTSGGSSSTGVAYLILPGQNPAAWLAVTQNSGAPTTSDTTLNAELTTADWIRSVAAYAHTTNATTYTLIHLWTSTTTVTINKEAVFGACNTTGGGVMPFESLEPSAPTLVSGDTLQNTITITIN